MLTFNQWIRYRFWPRNKVMIGAMVCIFAIFGGLPVVQNLMGCTAPWYQIIIGEVLLALFGGITYECFVKE